MEGFIRAMMEAMQSGDQKKEKIVVRKLTDAEIKQKQSVNAEMEELYKKFKLLEAEKDMIEAKNKMFWAGVVNSTDGIDFDDELSVDAETGFLYKSEVIETEDK